MYIRKYGEMILKGSIASNLVIQQDISRQKLSGSMLRQARFSLWINFLMEKHYSIETITQDI